VARLEGAVLDYQGGLSGAGFRFRNPHARGTCGCGTSFEA
jgi:iron-sulfur cluster assembly protein